MQRNHFLSRFAKGFATSLGLVFGLFLFVMLAYAFTTWNSGLAPQASPENGNITLSNSPNYMPGGWYGLCIQHQDYSNAGNDQIYGVYWLGCSNATAPATCAGSCGCEAGFTINTITGNYPDGIRYNFCIKK